MSQTTNCSNFTIAELTPGVFVRTSIPPANHSALRSGFAGYTPNPRWTPAKFHAWKLGRQWRSALASQEMVIRSSDSMLVPAHQSEESVEEPSYSSWWPMPSSSSTLAANLA